MNKQIFVVAELTAQKGKFDELKQIFENLATETRKEKGAVEYFFIEDQNKPNTLLSIERWENPDEEAKHWKTAHLKKALDAASKILVDNKAIIHKGFQII
ncbi:MAG: antibiotic biosynthesis monooxygenase [Saprospiraceae bacterium]|nr:antibiotic biosynthesis monooxygenase [Saprospiraceae bacterium]